MNMDRDLMKKLSAEQPLTVEEALWLDSALESGGPSLASELPDDQLSLAWRSTLNLELLKVSRRRRSLVFWRYGVVVTGVAAASLFVLMLTRPNGEGTPYTPHAVSQERETLEDTIIAGHQDALGQASLGVVVSYDSGI